MEGQKDPGGKAQPRIFCGQAADLGAAAEQREGRDDQRGDHHAEGCNGKGGNTSRAGERNQDRRGGNGRHSEPQGEHRTGLLSKRLLVHVRRPWLIILGNRGQGGKGRSPGNRPRRRRNPPAAARRNPPAPL